MTKSIGSKAVVAFAIAVLVSLGVVLLALWRDAEVEAPHAPAERPAEGARDAMPATQREAAGGLPHPERDAVEALSAPAPEAAQTGNGTDQARVTIFGRVVDRETGVPIAGARVDADAAPVRTDPLGIYEIEGTLRGDSLRLGAAATGYAATETLLRLSVAERTRCDFELAPLVTASLQIVDSETERPLADAFVYLPGAQATTIDANARAEVEVGVGDEVAVVASAPGHCVLRWLGVPDPRTELRLPSMPVAWVEGVVTDSAGRPITAAVRVAGAAERGLLSPETEWSPARLARWQLPGSLRSAAQSHAMSSDLDGRFRVPITPRLPGQWIEVTLPGCVPTRSQELAALEPGGVANVSLVLARGATVSGMVRCDGEPMFGGYVTWRQGSAAGQGWVTTGGAFEVREVPAGRVELQLRVQVSWAPLLTRTVDVAAGESVEVDFDWSSAPITGRVTMADGAGVERVIVQAFEPGPIRRRVETTKTEADGTYRLAVPTGTYDVVAERASAQWRRESVRSGTSDVDFVVPAIGQLRLRLVDAATRQPVRLERATRQDFAWRFAGESEFRPHYGEVDTVGRLWLELPVGTVDIALRFPDAGYVRCERMGLAVRPPESATDVQVELVRGVALRLHVRGATPLADELRAGRVVFALADAQVGSVRGPFAATDPAGNRDVGGVRLWLADPGLQTQMPSFDADGRATLNGLTPGRYRLAAFPDDLVFEPATFAIGENGGDVELRWRRR